MDITFDPINQCFIFDFEHDGSNDIITLTGHGYQVEAFGKCFYYGYEFADIVEGRLRSDFIKYVKFSGPLQDHPDLTRFMQKAVNELSQKVNLYNYDLVVMPESSSQVNNYLLRYIYRFAQPNMHGIDKILSLLQKPDDPLCAAIKKQNILIVDDITTSGSTLNEVLRALRILNEDNDITIFSLLGRKDLMADSV